MAIFQRLSDSFWSVVSPAKTASPASASKTASRTGSKTVSKTETAVRGDANKSRGRSLGNAVKQSRSMSAESERDTITVGAKRKEPCTPNSAGAGRRGKRVRMEVEMGDDSSDVEMGEGFGEREGEEIGKDGEEMVEEEIEGGREDDVLEGGDEEEVSQDEDEDALEEGSADGEVAADGDDEGASPNDGEIEDQDEDEEALADASEDGDVAAEGDDEGASQDEDEDEDEEENENGEQDGDEENDMFDLAADISATHLRSSKSRAASSSSSGIGFHYDSDIDNDSTLVVSEAEYASPVRRKVINLPTEAFSRGVSTEELQAEGWSDDHILLVQKLALRGFEPLLPRHWKWDFTYLPDALFEPPGEDEKAFIGSAHNPPKTSHHYRGMKALTRLMEMGGRVRDTFLSEGRMQPERQTRKHVQEFLKWTNRDADLDLRSAIPVLAFEVQPAGTPHADIEENARRKMARLHEKYREAFRAEPSIEGSPSPRSGATAAENLVAHPIPQIYALVASHTLIALVAFRPDSATLEQEVRTVAFFDLRDKDYDVWNSLAMAIVACHVRDVRVKVAEETGWGRRGPGVEMEVDDPDA
ncbi:hypothetical protein LTR29_004315 [Friedmanniomyces endolithicus]|nr:hypothetical protein LTR29_004315 [Friedmanniomyces endolithicus]